MRSRDGIEEGWGDPSGGAAAEGLVFLHVPLQGELRVVILSESPVRYFGHWAGGEMRQCRVRDCGFCARGMGRQERWVVCVWEPVGRFRALMEVGRYAASQVHDLAVSAGALAGLGVRFARDGQGKRARVTAMELGFDEVARDGLPAAWDVGRLLRDIWGRQE